MNPINNNWVFGDNAGLDFSTPIPTPTDGFSIDTGEGCASISNQSGQLLFYTDGRNVWDSTNTLRASGLQGNSSSTQSSIIVPRPGSSTEYYIFTADGASGTNNHFNGILLNTTTWGNTPLSGLPSTSGYSATEKVTAIQHANCIDFWIVTIITRGKNSYFRVFLLDNSGLTALPDVPINKFVNDLGYLKGSQDNTKIAVANWNQSDLYIFPFDNATGAVNISSIRIESAPVVSSMPANHPRAVYGLEFSPDNNLLYFSVLGAAAGQNVLNTGYIFQIDLNTSGSPVLVGTHKDADDVPAKRDGYSLGALQLGIDNRIYVAKDGEKSLGAIQNPNIIGPGCNVDFNFITLKGNSLCKLGLPNILPNACVDNCKEVKEKVNDLLNHKCQEKINTLQPCKGKKPCSCETDKDCKPIKTPAIKPCISVKWGDSKCDCLESNDVETMCLTVCNCYSNVTFKDFNIGCLEVTDENGKPVALLPDGNPSVQLIPVGPYCFGDIPPCTCISREFVLINKGAKSGKYKINISGICFDVCFHYDTSECFEFNICKD